MDILSLYYFSELAKDLHMTHCANRLYISQQTLSNHILRMEDYYGMPLFERKPSLALTEAGTQVLAFAHSVLKQETNLKDMLAEVAHEERGVIRIGGSETRLSQTLPEILPRFSERYPRVDLQITNAISKELTEMVLENELDLAITVSDLTADARLLSRGLLKDQIYLCVSEPLLQQYYGDETAALKKRSLQGASVGDFSRLPFALTLNRMGRMVKACFDEAGITPRAYITSTYTQIGAQTAIRQLTASFVPQMVLVSLSRSLPKDLNIFPLRLQGEPVALELTSITNRDRYLTGYTRFLQDQICEIFSYVQHFQMERIVE